MLLLVDDILRASGLSVVSGTSSFSVKGANGMRDEAVAGIAGRFRALVVVSGVGLGTVLGVVLGVALGVGTCA